MSALGRSATGAIDPLLTVATVCFGEVWLQTSMLGCRHRTPSRAAWRRTSKDNRYYHSVKLDAPSFTAPIYANRRRRESVLSNQHRLLGEDTRHRALR